MNELSKTKGKGSLMSFFTSSASKETSLPSTSNSRSKYISTAESTSSTQESSNTIPITNFLECPKQNAISQQISIVRADIAGYSLRDNADFLTCDDQVKFKSLKLKLKELEKELKMLRTTRNDKRNFELKENA